MSTVIRAVPCRFGRVAAATERGTDTNKSGPFIKLLRAETLDHVTTTHTTICIAFATRKCNANRRRFASNASILDDLQEKHVNSVSREEKVGWWSFKNDFPRTGTREPVHRR